MSSHYPCSGPQAYELGRTLRDSIFGKVKFGRQRNPPYAEVAIKISNLNARQSSSLLENPQAEVLFMRQLSDEGGHPHVLKLLDDFVDERGYHWSVFEFCAKGELFDLIDSFKGKRGLGENETRRLMWQLLQAVSFIHSKHICHLDISPENVMLDAYGNAKLIDFGMARYLQGPRRLSSAEAKPGKLKYMAPEIFSGQDFDGCAADVYSLGVVLFNMLTGVPPYNQPCLSDRRYQLIAEGQLRPLLTKWNMIHYMSSEALDLLQRMLLSEHVRPSIQEVMSHPWFAPLTSTWTFPSPPYLSLDDDCSFEDKFSLSHQRANNLLTPSPQTSTRKTFHQLPSTSDSTTTRTSLTPLFSSVSMDPSQQQTQSQQQQQQQQQQHRSSKSQQQQPLPQYQSQAHFHGGPLVSTSLFQETGEGINFSPFATSSPVNCKEAPVLRSLFPSQEEGFVQPFTFHHP